MARARARAQQLDSRIEVGERKGLISDTDRLSQYSETSPVPVVQHQSLSRYMSWVSWLEFKPHTF